MLSILFCITVLSLLFDQPLQWQFSSPSLNIATTVQFLVPERFVERLLSFYFAVHFLLIGIAILTFNHDVDSDDC